MTIKRLCLLSLGFLLAAPAWAQAPDAGAENTGAKQPPVPTVTLTVEWPGGAKPQHYALSVGSSGQATYTATDDLADPGDPYTRKLTVSDATRERIFAAAAALNYFNGTFDFTKHKIAFTGTKTLRYADRDRSFQTTYNWSENQQLMSLTQLLQAIASTITFGRQLKYLLRFDRLSLNDLLKAMEEAAKGNYLAELHNIEPTLRLVADDPNVMDLARQRARHLLRLAAQESGSPAPQ